MESSINSRYDSSQHLNSEYCSPVHQVDLSESKFDILRVERQYEITHTNSDTGLQMHLWLAHIVSSIFVRVRIWLCPASIESHAQEISGSTTLQTQWLQPCTIRLPTLFDFETPSMVSQPHSRTSCTFDPTGNRCASNYSSAFDTMEFLQSKSWNLWCVAPTAEIASEPIIQS